MDLSIKLEAAHVLSVLFEFLALVGAACFVLAVVRIIWKELTNQ